MAAQSDGPESSTTMVLVRRPCSPSTSDTDEFPSEDLTSSEQPIDLSRSKVKSSADIEPTLCRVSNKRLDVPPLIPINRALLKKRWINQNPGHTLQNDASLPRAFDEDAHPHHRSSPLDYIPLSSKQPRCSSGKKRRANEMSSTEDMDEEDDERKNHRDCVESSQWELRLDRAHSVPQLSALAPLVRCKSLSESRIAPTFTEDSGVPNRPVAWLLEQEQELQRQRLQQIQIDLASMGSSELPQAPDSSGGLTKSLQDYDSLLCVGYYTQMLQCFQAQEMLRQFAIQHKTDHDQKEALELSTTDVKDADELQETDKKQETPPNYLADFQGKNCLEEKEAEDSIGSDEHEIKRRSMRPLTGKHVRPGTGASPATLLTLRKKIEERQRAEASRVTK